MNSSLRRIVKQVEAFARGHWTMDLPKKTGSYYVWKPAERWPCRREHVRVSRDGRAYITLDRMEKGRWLEQDLAGLGWWFWSVETPHINPTMPPPPDAAASRDTKETKQP